AAVATQDSVDDLGFVAPVEQGRDELEPAAAVGAAKDVQGVGAHPMNLSQVLAALPVPNAWRRRAARAENTRFPATAARRPRRSRRLGCAGPSACGGSAAPRSCARPSGGR